MNSQIHQNYSTELEAAISGVVNMCMAGCYTLLHQRFPGGSDGKAFVSNAGERGSIPGLGYRRDFRNSLASKGKDFS